MTDTEILSTASYIKRLEKIATNYKTHSAALIAENRRLTDEKTRMAELLEQALFDMKDFNQSSCKPCKYYHDDACTLGRLSGCRFEWIHKAEVLELLGGVKDE